MLDKRICEICYSSNSREDMKKFERVWKAEVVPCPNTYDAGRGAIGE